MRTGIAFEHNGNPGGLKGKKREEKTAAAWT
jgi:hypothetical protein